MNSLLDNIGQKPLIERTFYERNTVCVARELVGMLLVRDIEGQLLIGRITETEAYTYTDDPASHAYRGKTPRNAAMFGPIGKLYVYCIYGIHYCCNIVAKDMHATAGAVLLRGIEPVVGAPLMRRHRQTKRTIADNKLVTGPGKLCQALQITTANTGLSVTEPGPLYLAMPQEKLPHVSCSKRIGIRVGQDKPWRFCML